MPWDLKRRTGLMPSKLHEVLNSVGVVVSILFSFFGFYYEHPQTSEAVDASISSLLELKSDSNRKLESATVDLLLINKGNTSITVADLWFEIDGETLNRCARKAELNNNDDKVIAPIVVSSKQASKVTLRVDLTPWPEAPTALMAGKIGDPPKRVSLPSPPTKVEKMSITIELTTVGPNYGRQVTMLLVGTLNIKDWA
jgi:hypothetical protein